MTAATKIFQLWVRFSQAIGILLVFHDKKADKFKLWKHSLIYCVVFGLMAVVLYPFTLLQFSKAMAPQDFLLMFPYAVSIITGIWDYIFFIITYVQQYRNCHKIRKTLNNFLYFYRHSKSTHQEFEEPTNLGRFQALFGFSVLIKTVLITIALVTISLLVKPGAFSILFLLLSFPAIVSFALCGQYFLAILVVSFFLTTTSRKLQALVTQLEQNRIISGDKFEEHFEFISNLHTQLYLMINELSSYFGLQISFVVFSNFKAIAVLAFQIFCMILLYVHKNIQFFNLNQIIAAGIAMIAALSIDVVFHFSICEKCTEHVSLCRRRVRYFNNLLYFLL